MARGLKKMLTSAMVWTIVAIDVSATLFVLEKNKREKLRRGAERP
jgi:hypothetical protein